MTEARESLSPEQARDAAHLLSETLTQLESTPTQRAYVAGAVDALRRVSAQDA